MRNSLLIAAISTAIAVVLGTFMALALVRYRFRGRGAARLLRLPAARHARGRARRGAARPVHHDEPATGFVTIVIAHMMFSVSYVVVTMRARLEGMDTLLEEAAMDLGANGLTTFRIVTLPLIAPGVAAAALLDVRAVGRRLRHHELHRRADLDVPAVHLGRGAAGRAAAGQRAGHDAADRRARADGAQRRCAAAPRPGRRAGGGRAGTRGGAARPGAVTRRHAVPPAAPSLAEALVPLDLGTARRAIATTGGRSRSRAPVAGRRRRAARARERAARGRQPEPAPRSSQWRLTDSVLRGCDLANVKARGAAMSRSSWRGAG